MKLTAKEISFTDQNSVNGNTDCVVVAAYENAALSNDAKAFENSSEFSLTAMYKTKQLSGKVGDNVLIYQTNGRPSVLVAGFGEKDSVTPDKFRRSMTAVAKKIVASHFSNITFFVDEVSVSNWSTEAKARYCAQAITYANYQFAYCKSQKQKADQCLDISITYATTKDDDSQQAEQGLTVGSAIGEGMNLARELGNLPGNICTPTYLADKAREMEQPASSLQVEVLSEEQMAALGMGSLLSVSTGSEQPAKLIAMEYQGADKSVQPTVLVGKGITFDSGGISLKPGAAMDEMKFDMCGAASVFGVMQAVLALKAKINLVGIVAAAENMPSGCATKPGDIVTSMSGKTIEVLNTDAEGRLVLCDVLTYAKRYQPKVVIDIATLTGACVIALGKHATGLFSNNDHLANSLLDAGSDSGDRAWRLPIWEDYQKQLKSNFADMANIGGRDAGSITAACFLARFAEDYPWAHLDIAGTAWLSGSVKGATGRPVSLLIHYLLNLQSIQ